MQTRGVLTRGRFKNVSEWPPKDREIWLQITKTATLIQRIKFQQGPKPVAWRSATRDKVFRGYGHFLSYLDGVGLLDPDAGPGDRITARNIDGYAAYMEGNVKLPTIRSRLVDLTRAIAKMSPATELSYLRAKGYSYPKNGDPLEKRMRLVEPGITAQLGEDLMEEAESVTEPSRKHAVLYRDGLIIGLQARLGLRLSNLTQIVIGVHLVRVPGGWQLTFSASDMKSDKPYERRVPTELVPKLDRYLEFWRLMLLDGQYDGEELWISYRPGAMTDNGVYYAIVTRTKEGGVKRQQHPHGFRDALTTSIAIEDPANVRVIMHALHHADASSQKAYNQARAHDASSALNRAVDKLRGRMKSSNRDG